MIPTLSLGTLYKSLDYGKTTLTTPFSAFKQKFLRILQRSSLVTIRLLSGAYVRGYVCSGARTQH